MSKIRPASPFDVLQPRRIKQLPATAGSTVVVAGTKVARASQVERLLVDAERDDDLSIAEARRLAAELRKRKRAAREKAYREKPERQAYLQAWRQANRDKLRAARQRWNKANIESRNALRRRYYAAHADKHRQQARERYHASKAAARHDPEQA